MNYTDLINAIFEFAGGLAIIPSIYAVYRDKQVKGVNWLTTGFFALWGLWNTFFYPYNGFILSCIAGVWLATLNVWWVVLQIHYSNKGIE